MGETTSRGNVGSTALMMASAYGHSEVVEELLAKKADVHAKDKVGTS